MMLNLHHEAHHTTDPSSIQLTTLAITLPRSDAHAVANNTESESLERAPRRYSASGKICVGVKTLQALIQLLQYSATAVNGSGVLVTAQECGDQQWSRCRRDSFTVCRAIIEEGIRIQQRDLGTVTRNTRMYCR